MSIIIKGMDMPKECGVCPFVSVSNNIPYCDILIEDIRNGLSCPLIEIPTPHGRLIDESTLNFETFYMDEMRMDYTAEVILEAEE